MWERCESTERPAELDTESSKKYNYVRKDITEESREQDGETVTVFTFLQKKVLKSDWEVYAGVIRNTGDIADITDALIELAGLIA